MLLTSIESQITSWSQVAPKRSRIMVILDKDWEMVLTRTVSWRMCIYYWKLNHVMKKIIFHFPFFFYQVPDRVAKHKFYYFLEGNSRPCENYFTCLFDTLPLGECHLDYAIIMLLSKDERLVFLVTWQRIIWGFIDDFSTFRESSKTCLIHLKGVLTCCEQKKMILNWEKCHFMVEKSIILGLVILSKDIEVDKTKLNLSLKYQLQSR